MDGSDEITGGLVTLASQERRSLHMRPHMYPCACEAVSLFSNVANDLIEKQFDYYKITLCTIIIVSITMLPRDVQIYLPH